MPDQDDNDGFLMRWSRRKRGESGPAKAEKPVVEAPSAPAEDEIVVASLDQQQAAETPSSQQEVTSDQEATGSEASESEAVPADLESVDIEALNYDSDYTRFMQEGVPEALKRRALRQLWRSDPILANIDGLNDYDGDFTDAALAVDVLKTIHKVGRGYLTDDDEDGDDLDDTDELEVADGEAVSEESATDVTSAADSSDGDADAEIEMSPGHGEPAETDVASSQESNASDDGRKSDT